MRAIAAPSSTLRSTFDLMPRNSTGAWENIDARLRALPQALDGLRDTYEQGRAQGRVAARRQVLAAAEQADTWARNEWFGTLAEEAAANAALPPTLVAAVRDGAAEANVAYAEFATYLRDTYSPSAAIEDGCGPERYRVGVRQMLGADFEPAEMYEWAWTDFHALRADIRATCERIVPGAGFAEVIHLLDTTPIGRSTAPTPIASGCRRSPTRHSSAATSTSRSRR